MKERTSVQHLGKDELLERFTALVDTDRRETARLLLYLAEVDRRKLYLEHAYPSMFAFCTERFFMSESMAAKRIRTARAACCFPCIFGILARGELHLTGAYQLAPHLTEGNHQDVLRRAKHRSMREIEKLIAEIAPKPDVPSSVRTVPERRAKASFENSVPQTVDATEATSGPTDASPSRSISESSGRANRPTRSNRITPLAPKRYKLTVTIDEEARAKLEELQGLLSHQIPDGDPAKILDRALDALLEKAKKQKAAITNRPRASQKRDKARNRAIPAQVRREVFARDQGRCAFVDQGGRRCGSTWKVEYHHRFAYAKGGDHESENVELRCRAHNQFEAELEYGAQFMERQRAGRVSPSPD